MTEEFQQNLGLAFIAYPLVVIILMRVVAKLPLAHPFVVLNWGLITMGAGLSTIEWLFYTGVVATLLFSIYSVLMLPTKEAIKISNDALSRLSSQNKPVNLFQELKGKFK
ncbi:hypothetical protein ACWU4D_10040 [Vibrio sp. WJH972]